MKKRFIVISSLITILLASFPMVVYAEPDLEDIENIAQADLPDYTLDSYFYDNYDLLPYIESNGTQYIDTGIKGSSDLKINLQFSNLKFQSTGWYMILFSQTNSSSGRLGLSVYKGSESSEKRIYFNSAYQQIYFTLEDYVLYNLVIDKNDFRLNNLSNTFTYEEFNSTGNLTVFGTAEGNSLSSYRLYKLSIYDYNANDGEGAYVRYFYPAKAKTSGVRGLYDSISKTFFVSNNNTSFLYPEDSKVMSFQIGDFITSGIGWIDDIFDFVIDTPIILFFFAVALAGSIYRWARRVVHF